VPFRFQRRGAQILVRLASGTEPGFPGRVEKELRNDPSVSGAKGTYRQKLLIRSGSGQEKDN
jgi:hypothetical protein